MQSEKRASNDVARFEKRYKHSDVLNVLPAFAQGGVPELVIDQVYSQ